MAVEVPARWYTKPWPRFGVRVGRARRKRTVRESFMTPRRRTTPPPHTRRDHVKTPRSTATRPLDRDPQPTGRSFFFFFRKHRPRRHRRPIVQPSSPARTLTSRSSSAVTRPLSTSRVRLTYSPVGIPYIAPAPTQSYVDDVSRDNPKTPTIARRPSETAGFVSVAHFL